MFVGLDIRSDSILAIRVGEDGTVGARPLRDGPTGTVAVDAVKAVDEGTIERPVLDPEVVVLGGTIATAGDLLVESSRTEAVRRMSLRTVPKIAASALGDEGAAIGAARAAMLQE